MNRRNLFWVGLAVMLLAVAVVTSGRRNDTGRPLDPTSTDGLGTRALIELVETFGADVSNGLPDRETATTLVLLDELTPDQRDELKHWVRDGGTLVVADPDSSLAPDLAATPLMRQDSIQSGTCTISGLEGLTLEATSFLFYPDEGSDDRCFAGAEGTYLHGRQLGEGRVLALGGALALTNQNLDEADNAVLAVELLLAVPSDRSTVAVVLRSA